MNKFGLLDDEASGPQQASSLAERIAMFSPVRPRQQLDIAAADAAAAQHGFVSREIAEAADTKARGRRRRAIPSEPTRHLAIRLSSSAYARFVAYADRQKLTYHDALTRLLDTAGE
jgi:hypothetical protein